MLFQIIPLNIPTIGISFCISDVIKDRRFMPNLGKIKYEISRHNMNIIMIKVYFEEKKKFFNFLNFKIIKIKPTTTIKKSKSLINVIY